MTLKQRRCLDFIRASFADRRVAPSYPEMCEALGLKSRGQAYALVCSLVDQGELVRTSTRARNLRLPEVDLTGVSTEAMLAELERRAA